MQLIKICRLFAQIAPFYIYRKTSQLTSTDFLPMVDFFYIRHPGH